MIHETIDFLPNVMKGIDSCLEHQDSAVWKLYFDGSHNKIGVGGGYMLISPTNERYYASFRFTFSYTNNVVEYEALVHGLNWAIKRGISCLQVFGDLELIVNCDKK